jgi:pimeloyl-ACP methyl ester carboxylesterase
MFGRTTTMNSALIRPATTWALWRLAAATLIVAATAVAASAQYCTPDQCDECDLHNCHTSCCYDSPDLWLFNTRCVPKCSNLDDGFNHISIKHWDASHHRWCNETLESFLAQEASMPTVIFAHGNTLADKGAMKQCWLLYGKMRCCPGQKRLVFWSWPAQIAIKRPLLRLKKLIMANLRIKYVYSEYQGYYMAKLVQKMSMTQRVTMGGHSYGGIIASAAAHYLGGGELRGLTLAGAEPVERPNLRVANVSGAFDNDALIPGFRFGQAFVAAEKVFVTRNCRDSTLDNWPKVSLRGRKALGVTGVNADLLGQYRDKLCMITMTADVGKSHYIKPHVASARFMNALCCFSFPACAACVNGTMPAATADAGKNAVAATADSDEDDSQTIELTAPGNFMDAIDESEQVVDDMADAA